MVTPFSLLSLYWVHAKLVERSDLLADSAGKAAWMVCFPQSCHYFALHELPTAIAAGTIHALVIQRAKILPVLNEKASLCQVTATHWKRKQPQREIREMYLVRMSALVCAADKWDDPGGLASFSHPVNHVIISYLYQCNLPFALGLKMSRGWFHK